MSAKKKIIISLLTLFSIALLSIAGVLSYYLSSPERTRHLIEKGIASASGAQAGIKAFEYSLFPVNFSLKGLTLRPIKDEEVTGASIPEITVDIHREGSFGKKRLIIERIALRDPVIKLDRRSALPGGRPGNTFFSRLIRGLTALFFFREIEFRKIEVSDGDLKFHSGMDEIVISKINGHMNEENLIEIACDARASIAGKGMELTLPGLKIATNSSISLVTPEVSARIKSSGAAFSKPGLKLENLNINSNISYDYKKQRLQCRPLEINGTGTFSDKNNGFQVSGPCSIHGALELIKEGGKVTGRSDLNLLLENRYSLILQNGDKIFGDLSADMEVIGDIFRPGVKACLKAAKISVSGKGKDLSLQDLEAEISGIADLQKLDIHANRFSINSKGLFDLQGSARADLRGQGSVSVEIREGIFFPSRFDKFLSEKTKHLIGGSDLEGQIRIKGRVQGLRRDHAWKWDCSLKTFLNGNRAFFSSGGYKIRGTIKGEIAAKGEVTNPDLDINLEAIDGRLESTAFRAFPFKARFKINGRFPLFDLEDFALTVPNLDITAREKPINLKAVEISSKRGSFDSRTKAFNLPDISISSDLLKNLRLSGQRGDRTFELRVKGSNTGVVELANSYGIIPEGWKLKGLDTFFLDAEREDANNWILKAGLELNRFDFEDPKAVFMGEGLKSSFFIKAGYGIDRNAFSFDTSVRLKEGEVLYDRFYLDLGKTALTSDLRGTYRIDEKALEISETNVTLKDMFRVDLGGNCILGPGLTTGDIDIDIHDAPVYPLFRMFVVEPFKAEKPELESIKAAGTISARFEAKKGKDDTRIFGHFHWKKGELSHAGEKIKLEDLSLDLPVWIQKGKPGAATVSPSGNLKIGSVKMPFISKQSFSSPLKAGPNSLFIESSTAVSTHGGTVLIGPVSFSGIFGPSPSVESSIKIDNLETRPFMSETAFKRADGTIKGELDPVRFSNNRMTAKGKISAEIFGGQIVFSDIAAASVFSKGPLISFDAGLNGLDLAEMTTGTSFGKIEGTLEGHVNDLEFAYGQPQRFDLLLETIEKKGVKQKISVKAVDNIARIGGGQSPFIGLAGAISSLFKEFPYEKIGVRAFLENDTFRINGTIKEEDKEYIVKRGSFSGVNIVNQNPDNRISFKDMVKRIKRVTKGGSPTMVR